MELTKAKGQTYNQTVLDLMIKNKDVVRKNQRRKAMFVAESKEKLAELKKRR